MPDDKAMLTLERNEAESLNGGKPNPSKFREFEFEPLNNCFSMRFRDVKYSGEAKSQCPSLEM
jgi:hypothetical protein